MLAEKVELIFEKKYKLGKKLYNSLKYFRRI